MFATELIGIEPGDRVPTIRHLAARCGSSLGATLAEVTRMEDEGLVSLDRRGRSGTFLVSRSLGGLWFAARRSPLVIALPLPSTPRVHGLATAIKTLLTEASVQCFLVFIRGSRNRLTALREARCHVAVMSSLAADERRSRSEIVILELPNESFVREHRVYYVADIPSGSRL
ncbi:MAG: YhfZ family protein, partial [Candidatus Limnocylindrales bacterium]